MKFYTIEWWCGIQSGDVSDPMDAFRQHLNSIRDQLPPDLLVLQDSVSLHDANLHLLAHGPGALLRRSPYLRDSTQLSNFNRLDIEPPLNPFNSKGTILDLGQEFYLEAVAR